MPQKRSSNAAKRKGGAGGRGAAGRAPARAASEPLVGESARNDIAGVLLAVLAVAMLISLVAPSGAVLTDGTARFLTLCFGIGAVLCPLAVFAFALTFFTGSEGPLGKRAAVGLTLIVVALLSLMSLNVPGAAAEPDLVLRPGVLEGAGGYVGGFVAWALLEFCGPYVGDAILVGLAVVGVVVCGFSITDFLSRSRERVARLRDRRERRRVEREVEDRQGAEDEAGSPQGDVVTRPAPDPDATSFIGGRTTSVLRRRPRSDEAPTRRLDEADRVRTEPLERRHHPDLDVGKARPVSAGRQEQAATEAPSPVVPDFLEHPPVREARPEAGEGSRRPSGRGRSRRRASAGKGPSRAGKATAPSAQVGATRAVAAAAEAAPVGSAAAPPASVSRPGDDEEGFRLPPLSMLSSNPNSAGTASSKAELEETRRSLQETLQEFGLRSRVVDYVSGPLVTTFRIEMGEGERVSKIRNLEDDIALTLAAEKVRIFAPIPGTSYVGIEIPNKTRENVHLGDVLPYAKGGPLEVAVGRDSAGKPVIADIARMPHMLVAGTTGSGKSVMINSMIMSILMRSTPKQVRLILVDPKRVEFPQYNGVPHLYVPVVTEPRQAASALQWAVSEMERRLKVFERAGARDIKVYNRMCTHGKLREMDNPPDPMPYLVVVIDELSDLMMVAGKDVEASIVRIAQLARAAGIHLIIATQRPSANVVTGLIKSNIDTRAALKVSSGLDSRVILDETGAERLLGNGDMLFKNRGLTARRVLGCYTSDSEISSVVDFIRSQGEPEYHEEILSMVTPGQPGTGERADLSEDDDPLVWEAAQIVVESQLGSTSGLQRRLKVGYARAGRIMDMLEAKGVVGPPDGSKPREVLLDEDGLEELRTQEAAYREV